jgi:hypothetical protein
VATLGRYTDGQGYCTPPADVIIEVDAAAAVGHLNLTVGVFGAFNSLTISLPDGEAASGDGDRGLVPLSLSVLAQDLLADAAEDITNRVNVSSAGGSTRVRLGGEIIASIGAGAATAGDVSEPGLVLRIARA